MSEHVVAWTTYLKVWIALMCLMVLTAGLSFYDLGDWSTVVALTNAVVKTVLIVLVFIHVKYEYEGQKITLVVIVAGFFWLGLLLLLTLTDYLSRGVVQLVH
jgi:cytochrome c oxidase subunit 4